MGTFRLTLGSLALLALLQAPAGRCGASSEFGFAGPETFPIDDGISELHAADLDGDGLTDLVVANNAKSRISLLYNQTGQTNAPTRKASTRDINQLPADARFRIESLASEKRIAAMVVRDFNGDGRPDIAYYGDPRELVVHYNAGTNNWSLPKSWPIQDGLLTPNALSVGDLNGDQRADLLLLGEKHIYWLPQTSQQGLGEPQTVPYSETAKAVQCVDIDGDGRQDLLLVDWDSANPFRVRLQNPLGRLGPEFHFALPPIRAYMADQLDRQGRTELVTIARNSGRAQVSQFIKKEAEPLLGPWKLGQFTLLPLTRTSSANRGAKWVDVNRDGLPDLLVAEPESGQLQVTLQESAGTFSQSFLLPSLTGVTDLGAASQGREPAQVYLLSGEERQLGVMTFDDHGVAPFPVTIPLPGKPIAVACGQLDPKAGATLAVIVDQDGQRSLWWRQGDEAPRTQKLSASFRSNPARMAFHDADQDGRPDLVVLVPYEKMKFLLQSETGQFNELDLAPPGGSLEQAWFGAADLDGDGREELLLAQRNFVRAVLLERAPAATGGSDWVFRVKDQVNGASSRARILAAAALPAREDGSASLCLLDAERKALTLCQRQADGIWAVVRNIPLPFAEFSSIQPLALGGEQANGVAFIGPAAAAWLPLFGDTWQLVELDSYETEVEDGRLNDVVSGDLNQDGRKDLVFLEMARSFLELVLFTPDSNLVPATRWQVFEERTFRNRRSSGPEPREALVADLTGDGKNDLAVLVHDRILVYPQE